MVVFSGNGEFREESMHPCPEEEHFHRHGPPSRSFCRGGRGAPEGETFSTENDAVLETHDVGLEFPQRLQRFLLFPSRRHLH